MAEQEQLITSAANPVVKRLRALASGAGRRDPDVFFCEGVQPVWRAVEAGARVELLVVAPELVAGTPAERLVAEEVAAGRRVVRVSAALFSRISERDGPSGVAAVVRRHAARLSDLAVAPDSLFGVLHEVASPGNLGSIIRSADAAGAAGVVLTGVTADPFSPPAVKASMGSLFNVHLAGRGEVDDLFAWAESSGVSVLTTSAHAERSYLEGDFARPLAVVFGNEGRGLPAGLLDRGSASIRIPMVGSASSLNLSVAVGVLLFELQRGRLG